MIQPGLDRPMPGGVAALRNFYDPGHTFEGDELSQRLLKNRRHLARACFVGQEKPAWYTGKTLVVAECVSLGLPREVVTEVFEFDATMVNNIYTRVETHTDQAAEAVAERARYVLADEEARRELQTKTGLVLTTETPVIVVAALLMALEAHEGQKRVNGDRDYITHPVAAALLYQQAWYRSAEQAHEKGFPAPDEKWMYQQIVVNLLHDVVEDSISKKGGSFLVGSGPRVTPLLIRNVLSKLGEDETSARAIVDDLLRVTKTRDPDGRTFPDEQYAGRCYETIRSMIAKFSDTVHNGLIDRKQSSDSEKMAELEAEYQAIQQQIRIRLGDQMGDDFGMQCIENILEIGREFENNHQGFMKKTWELPFGVAPKQLTAVA